MPRLMPEASRGHLVNDETASVFSDVKPGANSFKTTLPKNKISNGTLSPTSIIAKRKREELVN